jgi:hypothetical protein
MLIVFESSAVPHLHHEFSQTPLKIIVNNTGSPDSPDRLMKERSTSLEVYSLREERPHELEKGKASGNHHLSDVVTAVKK